MMDYDDYEWLLLKKIIELIKCYSESKGGKKTFSMPNTQMRKRIESQQQRQDVWEKGKANNNNKKKLVAIIFFDFDRMMDAHTSCWPLWNRLMWSTIEHCFLYAHFFSFIVVIILFTVFILFFLDSDTFHHYWNLFSFLFFSFTHLHSFIHYYLSNGRIIIIDHHLWTELMRNECMWNGEKKNVQTQTTHNHHISIIIRSDILTLVNFIPFSFIILWPMNHYKDSHFIQKKNLNPTLHHHHHTIQTINACCINWLWNFKKNKFQITGSYCCCCKYDSQVCVCIWLCLWETIWSISYTLLHYSTYTSTWLNACMLT